jgi:hypothetical protein
MTNIVFIEIWQENLKTKQSWKVSSKKIDLHEKGISLNDINLFFVNFLLENIYKDFFLQKNESIHYNQIDEKIEQLEIIKEVKNNYLLEVEIYGAKFFVKYSNFINN